MGLLQEKPMHPYEKTATLREHRIDAAVKSRHRDALRHRVTRPRGLDRAGNRPQRTVYTGADLGCREFTARLDGLVRTPSPDDPLFLGTLTCLGALGPERARDALTERAGRLLPNGKPVLVCAGGGADARAAAGAGVAVAIGTWPEHPEVDAVLVRHDGHAAWVRTTDGAHSGGLAEALRRWCPAPAAG
jgi:hypothetical protein